MTGAFEDLYRGAPKGVDCATLNFWPSYPRGGTVTPFNIRKRLKTALGMTPTVGDERCSVTFVLPNGTERTVTCEKHYTLLMAADANGLTISTGRRAGGTCPDGACDLCRVEVVVSTGLSAKSEHEQQMMDDHTAETDEFGEWHLAIRTPHAPGRPDGRTSTTTFWTVTDPSLNDILDALTMIAAHTQTGAAS